MLSSVIGVLKLVLKPLGEIKLWRFCLSSTLWITGQISKSWTYVGIGWFIWTFGLKTYKKLRMISTSVWLGSRLPIATNKKWERMGCGWMFYLIHMNWICSVLFEMTMVANNESMLKEVLDKNSITWLWTKISSSPILNIKLLKFIKLAKITCVQVLGFVEDEKSLSTMVFIKNKLRNHLLCHLDLCTWLYMHNDMFFGWKSSFFKLKKSWKISRFLYMDQIGS